MESANTAIKNRKRHPKLFEYGFVKKPKQQETLNQIQAVDEVPVVVVSNEILINDIPPRVESVQDIASYVAKTSLTQIEKHKVLSDSWVPDANFVFPVRQIGRQGRKFQGLWLIQYPWLSYSKAQDAAYCKNCVAFCKNSVGKGNHQVAGKLVTYGFTKWDTALKSFNSHHKFQYHTDAVYFSEQFEAIYSEKTPSIVDTFQSSRAALKESNRTVLSSIIDTIIFCGRQNIALRGHSDHGRLELESPCHNDGNFRALLRFRIGSGDSKLEHHIKTAPANALYTSAPIQNQLIKDCGSVILQSLVKRINNAKCFAILADETTDISTVEQLTLCVRYVDTSDNIPVMREDFLKFVAVTDLTGEGLADSILSNLDSIGIDLYYSRGQSYDGAAAMSSKLKGVQARVLKMYPKALYTYCASHCLNLVITDASSVQPIRNMLGVIKEINNFFSRSAKRKHVLKTLIDESKESASSRVRGLIQLCETPWVERHDSIISFLNNYNLIVKALELIETTTNDSETRGKSFSLRKSMLSFDILVSLHSAVLLLALSLPISKALQATNADLQLCYEQVMEITAEIRRIRSNSDDEFKKIFDKSILLAGKLDIPVKVPRLCSRQTKRTNVDTRDAHGKKTGSDHDLGKYFRAAIFVPFVDEFLNSLTTRFENYASNVSSLLNILPRYIGETSVDDFQELLRFNESDLDCDHNSFEGEYRLWKNKWSKTQPNQFPNSVIEAYQACDTKFYPNISKLLKILCTLPITTATAERSFSSLKRLKTYLRNTMSEDRLNGLALLHIHLDVNFAVEDVLTKFNQSDHRIFI